MTNDEPTNFVGNDGGDEIEKPEVRWFAIVDEGKDAKVPGQLIGFEKRECLAADHVRAPGRVPVPVNCDLALRCYRIVKKPSGRETFEAIHHGKDLGAENHSADTALTLADIARLLLKLDGAGHLDDDERQKLTDYLNSFNAR